MNNYEHAKETRSLTAYRNKRNIMFLKEIFEKVLLAHVFKSSLVNNNKEV